VIVMWEAYRSTLLSCKTAKCCKRFQTHDATAVRRDDGIIAEYRSELLEEFHTPVRLVKEGTGLILENIPS
jgi:hypothetical protein